MIIGRTSIVVKQTVYGETNYVGPFDDALAAQKWEDEDNGRGTHQLANIPGVVVVLVPPWTPGDMPDDGND